MKKIFRTVLLVGTIFVLAVSMAVFAACGGKEGTDDAVKYGVTVSETANGEITSSAAEAAEGTQVTLTITPDSGYRLGELKVDGEAVNVYDARQSGDGGRLICGECIFCQSERG